ncbi:uncharacterized protein LOC135310073 [Plodia interpunctella]|uniref:uncharacterized protein LOC135310073 n=1 Tax=Plodia interpunctella TaxID=58824 RepID=UPI0031015FA3
MKGFTLWLVMITCTIKSLNCLFFHEPSASVIEGKNKLIGYSFGYQKQQKKLVSGDPSGVIGNVEYCPVSTSLDEKRNLKFEKCESINEINSTFSKHLSNGRRASDDYKYMFGATIAILNDSFVTCAPMWSGEYDFYGTRKFFVWGACFDVRRQTVTPLTGLYGHPRKSFNTEGSFGWRTLVDEINNILLISKPASPSLHGDIAYVNKIFFQKII